MTSLPFNQRFGLNQGKPIENDFPESARVALAHLLATMNAKSFFESSDRVIQELYRTARITKDPSDYDYRETFLNRLLKPLIEMQWSQIYIFCERLYGNVISSIGYDDNGHWFETTSVIEIRTYFSEELNIILDEENIVFEFVNGKFSRRGRAQTQRALERVGLVLTGQDFVKARTHYNKAIRFFQDKEEPDFPNCIKEAMCALEASIEALTKLTTSKDFAKVIKQIQGNGPGQLPPPIAEAMIKLHAYRGSGEGVSHASSEGNKVTSLEAELILSTTASFITYLIDLLHITTTDDVPF